MRKLASLLFVAGSLAVSIAAHADGPEDEYDHGSPAIARSLGPNEYVVNADGAPEDPQHRMSDTARAYRNGLINGRRQEAARRQQVNVPPLPGNGTVAEDDASTYTSIPPQPVQRPYQPAYRPAAPAAPYAQYQQPPQYPQPPVQYVQQQNVYASPPPEQEDVYPASPPPVYMPQPQPYAYGPQPGVVVAIGSPVYRTLPTGYWPRGYVPRWPVQPRGYGYGYYRGW